MPNRFSASVLAMSIVAAGPISLAVAHAAAPTTAAQASGIYRHHVGRFLVTALSDGSATVPWDDVLQGMTPEKIRAIFTDGGETPKRDTSINAFLVDTGSKRILIDAGAGELFGECCGRLPQMLAKAGYPADTIDAILLTHLHGDHSGGVAIGDRRVFPNADLYLSRREHDFWTSDAEQARARPQHRKMFVEGRAALAPYAAAGRIRVFDGPAEIFPGIFALPAPGHTPGHSFFRVADGPDRLLVVGDLVHAAEVQLPHPEVTAGFDIDQAMARATRERVFAELARTHELVAADHIEFPGLGHITRDGAGYRWSAIGGRAAVRKAHR